MIYTASMPYMLMIYMKSCHFGAPSSARSARAPGCPCTRSSRASLCVRQPCRRRSSSPPWSTVPAERDAWGDRDLAENAGEWRMNGENGYCRVVFHDN